MPKLTPTRKTVCTKTNYVRFDDFEYYFFTKETFKNFYYIVTSNRNIINVMQKYINLLTYLLQIYETGEECLKKHEYFTEMGMGYAIKYLFIPVDI